MITQPLTNVQLELLKLFKYQVDEKELLDIKDILAQYFANKATSEIDKLWDENNWNNATMEQWINENMRISKS